MSEKAGSIIKRVIFGYVFFFLLIIAGLSIELSFVVIITIGMGAGTCKSASSS